MVEHLCMKGWSTGVEDLPPGFLTVFLNLIFHRADFWFTLTWEPVWKLCIHPLVNCKCQLQMHLFMDLGPGIAAVQNFSFSLISAWPRAPQRATIHRLFRISYFLLHFLSFPSPTSFLFAWHQTSSCFTNSLLVTQLSLSKQGSLGPHASGRAGRTLLCSPPSR